MSGGVRATCPIIDRVLRRARKCMNGEDLALTVADLEELRECNARLRAQAGALDVVPMEEDSHPDGLVPAPSTWPPPPEAP